MTDLENVRELGIDIDATYSWSVGASMERFVRGLADRRLLGARCPKCSRVLVPPRKVCERCFVETDEWVEVGPGGTVVSFTVGEVELDGKAGGFKDLDVPVVTGLIKPDGADTAFVHVIGEADPREVACSMRVEAVWADEAGGALSDLRYFKPL
ncbi:MAG: Zn-ribbon domain-containing OB-fold protein [Actinobacteria bacterium]|nr:Zn-ribbon domain-containing OB-fold protein [Actinomycetota bacterium]MBU1945035.1 Zn-ribbon domain-containing OB-fold protein [Actinomycetota bacterium]MBU2686629.1 Zn-ribbon domain-containing OB-fold protein [Actinomycetota bacterium]